MHPSAIQLDVRIADVTVCYPTPYILITILDVVKDAHHFHVVGEEKYKMYQELATEKLLGLHEQGKCLVIL